MPIECAIDLAENQLLNAIAKTAKIGTGKKNAACRLTSTARTMGSVTWQVRVRVAIETTKV